MDALDLHPVRGTREEAKLPLALLGLLAPLLAWTLFAAPSGKLIWSLEVGPGLLGIAALAIAFRRFPMSRWVYACVFVHVLVLTYGGFYSYAKTPLGDWAKETFHLARNHYDRVGHLSFGFFPAFAIREVLLRQTPLRPGRWLTFLVISVVLGAAAFYELIEWWASLVLDPAGGATFLGTQGDLWDTQWDMFLAMVGATAALALFGSAHLRSLQALMARGARAAAPRL